LFTKFSCAKYHKQGALVVSHAGGTYLTVIWSCFEAKVPKVSPLRADPIVASFPGRRRNGLATSASSNCYFHCQKLAVPIKFQNIVTWPQ